MTLQRVVKLVVVLCPSSQDEGGRLLESTTLLKAKEELTGLASDKRMEEVGNRNNQINKYKHRRILLLLFLVDYLRSHI